MPDPKRILLVDLEPSLSEVLTSLFAGAGNDFIVRKLPDPRLLLAMVKEFTPDIIFMDHETSGLRNKFALQMLKGHALMRHIPVIYLTAHHDGGSIAKAAGADGHLTKPFEAHEIMAMTKQFVRK
jgi:CheY-like chemotaxis protein